MKHTMQAFGRIATCILAILVFAIQFSFAGNNGKVKTEKQSVGIPERKVTNKVEKVSSEDKVLDEISRKIQFEREQLSAAQTPADTKRIQANIQYLEEMKANHLKNSQPAK